MKRSQQLIQDAARERIRSAVEAFAARCLTNNHPESDCKAVAKHAGAIADSILWEIRHEYRIVRRSLPERSGT